jgi:hypothetical protein
MITSDKYRQALEDYAAATGEHIENPQRLAMHLAAVSFHLLDGEDMTAQLMAACSEIGHKQLDRDDVVVHQTGGGLVTVSSEELNSSSGHRTFPVQEAIIRFARSLSDGRR